MSDLIKSFARVQNLSHAYRQVVEPLMRCVIEADRMIESLTAENRRVVAEIKVADTERDLARSRAQGWFDSLKIESARADRLAAALRDIKPLTASLSFDLWQKCERIIDAALAGTADVKSAGQWKPGSEPPDSDRWVLALHEDGMMEIVNKTWVSWTRVTHWYELPPKPELSK